MNFLAKPALSLLSHEACPQAPFICHGYIADGTCHGVCGQGHPGMTNGAAILMSATHAYSYECRKNCKGNIENPSCHSCIISAMGVTTQSARKKRSWFSDAFDTVSGAVSGAVDEAKSHIGTIVQGVTCTVKIAPTIAECVSSFEGNLEGLMNCAGAASGSKDCVCKVICSVYPEGCNFCNGFGNFGKK